jgi:hypothetical protein
MVYIKRSQLEPKITICIPVYEQTKLLDATLYNISESKFRAVIDHDLVLCIAKQSVVLNRLACLAHSRTDLILWLDDDVEFRCAGWDLYLHHIIASDPTIGAVGINVVHHQNKDLSPERKAGDVHDVCGAAFITRQIDGINFDPIYQGSQFEDTDYCFQLRQAGYRVVQDNGLYVIHHNTMKNANNFNALLFKKKWHL